MYGFKSFGFRNTSIMFEKGLIAITGPNGSGKSNVLDAIIFVLGENSPKTLRVDRFQSLFHDTQSSSHRIIRVSLTLDNTDRGIPIDDNNITITREIEGFTGESQYYLNKKKVSKSSIMDVLELVIPGPSKLHIVQQGMITRISELNAEERRSIIEDISGLSYFDEKKEEAIKQLNEADRRLEIAFARMSEVKKRITELEIERKDKIRYMILEKEIRRYKSINISNKINKSSNSLKNKNQQLEINNTKISSLDKNIIEIKNEIDVLEKEKHEYMQKMNQINKVKAKIETTLSTKIYSLERNKAIVKESQLKINTNERRIPHLETEKTGLKNKILHLQSKINDLEQSSKKKKEEIIRINEKKYDIDKTITDKREELSVILKNKNKIEIRINTIRNIKNKIEIEVARKEELKRNNNVVHEKNNKLYVEQHSQLTYNVTLMEELEENLRKGTSKIGELEADINKLISSKQTLNKEIDISENTLSKATKLVSTHEASLEAAYRTSKEDASLAIIFKNKEYFNILGIVKDFFKWNKIYEKAIVSGASEWLKSIVVENAEEMLRIAEFSKKNGLSKIRIIPLDIISNIKYHLNINYNDRNILGTLDQFVTTDIKELARFIFGNIILTKDSVSAYRYATKGYKAVSLYGELFEPLINSLYLNFSYNEEDVINIFSSEKSLNELKSSLQILENTITRRNDTIKAISNQIQQLEENKNKIILENHRLKLKFENLRESVNKGKRELSNFEIENKNLEKELYIIEKYLQNNYKRRKIIEENLAGYINNLKQLDKENIERQILDLEREKFNVVNSINQLNYEIQKNENTTKEILNTLSNTLNYIKKLEEEKFRLIEENKSKKKEIENLLLVVDEDEKNIKSMRDEEQEIINSSSDAYSILKRFDDTLKALRENEKISTRTRDNLEKENILLKKEIRDLEQSKQNLFYDLKLLGYKYQSEIFDVRDIVDSLNNELENMKEKINLKSDETYIQIIEGYRSMSDRKNQLEKERNSITTFIDEIIQEKKAVFMEAFEKVDKDIRNMFSAITGGNAWLELEDPDNIFSKGISLIVQFPNKPKRESSSLSGGEKTIAGIIFLLSLQSLKPSPFYLMDEVDAHLDALNTERLINILRERSKKSQIIMVTLKDVTVGKSDLVYGVFPTEGVSQIIKYKYNNALSLRNER